jgi:hypothetical protein
LAFRSSAMVGQEAQKFNASDIVLKPSPGDPANG